MQILIIGGTGFLGYHATHELVRRGHDVTVLALPPEPPKGTLPDSVKIKLCNISDIDDEQLVNVLRGFEAVVFAAGADDRAVPEAPAFKFFYEVNIKTSVRVTTAARCSGVRRFVMLGSYFSYFDRQWPELALADNHPYINSRKQQLELCTIVAGSEMAMVVLELPYIFGSMPGVVPLWAPLVNYLRSSVLLYFTNGGSNMVSVHRVAEAIAGACENVNESHIYQIGDRNVDWTEFLQALCKIIGRKDDTVRILQDDSIDRMGWIMDTVHSVMGKEAGLHTAQFSDFQTAYTYFDPTESQEALGYSEGGLEQAWEDTVAACPETPMMSGWRQFSEKAQRLLGD